MKKVDPKVVGTAAGRLECSVDDAKVGVDSTMVAKKDI